MHGIELINFKDVKRAIDRSLSDTKLGILEFGVSRDFGSSSHLYDIHKKFNVPLGLCDPNKDTLDNIKLELKDEEGISFYYEKGEDLDDSYYKNIGLAHLDGFDIVTWHPHKQSTIDAYTSAGIDLLRDGNHFSALSHLQIAEKLLVNNPTGPMTILFDDTWWQKGIWKGKGATAIPYLLANGFRCISKPSTSFYEPRKYKWGVAFER
ncbi:hypothetical protein N9782_04650 [Emcibacteraceae bacterium]|jgi:hypothetical protein|nr:hypothetical protein [Emcibacteraceae bacterium]